MLKQKIALFGTSADPPTTAHQKILLWLSLHYDYVAVWASDNPFKSHQTDLEHRTKMLQLMIEEINSPRYNLNLHPELSSPRAIETVLVAQQFWPNSDLSFVIGSDLINQLIRWYQIEELFKRVGLLIIPRPGYPIDPITLDQLTAKTKIAIASLEPPAISSTNYRLDHQDTTLTPFVANYIHQKQLYQICP